MLESNAPRSSPIASFELATTESVPILESEMSERYKDYLNNKLLDTIQAMLQVEEDWLKSINAPVKRLPEHVVEAVATRVVLTSVPLEYTRYLIELIGSNQIIKEARQ